MNERIVADGTRKSNTPFNPAAANIEESERSLSMGSQSNIVSLLDGFLVRMPELLSI
jgi:hypothetical protein